MAEAILGHNLGEGDKITIGTKGTGEEMELSFKTKKAEPKVETKAEDAAEADTAASESDVEAKREIKSDLETEAPEEAEAD